jgi:hypothetical protein
MVKLCLLPAKCKAGNAWLYIKDQVFFKVFYAENGYLKKATGYKLIPAGYELVAA